MRPIESLVITIVVFLIGMSIIVGTIYLIITLVQIRKTAREVENTVKKVNIELDFVNRTSNKFMLICGKFSSLLTSVSSILFYAFSKIIKNKRGENE